MCLRRRGGERQAGHGQDSEAASHVVFLLRDRSLTLADPTPSAAEIFMKIV
jgi:hypothetical protein